MNDSTEIIIPGTSWIQSGATAKIFLINEDDIGEIEKLSDIQPQTQNSQCKFLDLFWFLHSKIENNFCYEETTDIDNVDFQPNELELISISFNLNFGNVRFNGYKNIFENIHNKALFLPRNSLVINAAVYPAGIFNILNLKNGEKFAPIEQLFIDYDPDKNPWHDEISSTIFEKANDRMRLLFKRPTGESFFYVFKDKQLEMLNSALNYIVSDGFNVVGNAKIK